MANPKRAMARMARIDAIDPIEGADRIVAAHERELAATKLAAEMPTYDVEGNERHKAACELRDMKIGKLSRHWDFVCSLAARLNIPRPKDEPYEDYELHELIRDKLVNLLEGECNFSTPKSYMACEDGDPNPAEMSPDEQTSVTLGTWSPITGDLRDAVSRFDNFNGDEVVTMHGVDFDRRCDAIDSVHAQLEREYEDLRMKYVNINRHAQHVERENESLKAELDRVLREQEDRNGWLKDVDGVPINIGDVMVYADGNTCPLPVVALVPPAVFLTDEGPRYADMCRHQPDTWERIIEDALDGYHDTDFEKLVSRCKALAGDAE